ncbi:hypothetical protein GCM10009604_17770 [Corynebacterium aurimucosum]
MVEMEATVEEEPLQAVNTKAEVAAARVAARREKKRMKGEELTACLGACALGTSP